MNSLRAPERAPALPVFRALFVAGCVAATATPVLAQDADGRVISLSAGLQLTHDSNVPRASSRQSPIAQNAGDGKLADTYLKGLVGLNFDRQISQQRVQANAQIDGYKYNNYSDFDNIGYRAGLNYDWVVGRPFFGKLGVDLRRYEPQIQDGQISANNKRNRIDSQFLYFQGGFRFTPSLSLIAGVDYERRRNRLQEYKGMDVDIDGIEGGLRWSPGTGLELDFVYRHSKGDYSELASRLPNGNPAMTAYTNNYKQNDLLLRASYRPNEDTRLGGFVGQTKREFDVAELEGVNRDFDGLTLGGDLEWALTGLTKMRVRFGRTIAPQDGVYTASYVEANYIEVRPRIMLTGRIAVEPFVHYINYKYSGDRYVGQQTRKDDVTLLGAQATYELTRTVNLVGELRHERRNSNYSQWDFKANVISVGVLARF